LGKGCIDGIIADAEGTLNGAASKYGGAIDAGKDGGVSHCVEGGPANPLLSLL